MPVKTLENPEQGAGLSQDVLDALDNRLREERQTLSEQTIVRTNHHPRGLLGLWYGKIPRNPATEGSWS